MTTPTTPAAYTAKSRALAAIAALRAEPNGIHFQLCPFAGVTLHALVDGGLVAVGTDGYVSLTDAGKAVAL